MTFETSLGCKHAPYNLILATRGEHQRNRTVPCCLALLGQKNFSFLRFCMRKSLIHFFESRLRFGINCVKSDKFRSNRPENQSGPLFSATADPENSGSGGRPPPEGGLSAGAGSGESCCCWADLIRHQVWLEVPLDQGFTQEVKS